MEFNGKRFSEMWGFLSGEYIFKEDLQLESTNFLKMYHLIKMCVCLSRT